MSDFNFDYKQNLIELSRQLGLTATDIENINAMSQFEAKKKCQEINNILAALGISSRKIEHPEIKF
jgi:hypothetical protein